MAWSKWKAALATSVAWAGLASSQQHMTPQVAAPSAERYVTIQEPGKAPARCRVLNTTHRPDGSEVHQVQAPNGEIMTIVGTPVTGTQRSAGVAQQPAPR